MDSVLGAGQELAHKVDAMNTKYGHALMESLCVDLSWNERGMFVCVIAGSLSGMWSLGTQGWE